MTDLKNITLTHEFQQVCDIFNLTPERVVQDFVNNVSLAEYICDPYSPTRWANTFVLEYVIAQVESEEIMNSYGAFAERLVEAVLSNPKEVKEVAQRMLDEWHTRVLEDRIKNLTDGNLNSNKKP